MRPLSLLTLSIARRAAVPVLATITAVVVAACSSGATPEPSAAPGSSAPGVTAADEAVELVLAQDPRFERIRPYDPDLIGQAAWTKVEPTMDGGWTVTVRIGWGDCPSGCIDEHLWTYEVTTDGEVTLVDEEGPEVPADVSDIP